MLPPEERIKKLTKEAEIKIDFNIPIKRYYRSGSEILKLAKTYESEGILEKAYIFYLRFLILFIEKVEDHPERKSVSPDLLHKMKIELKTTLSTAQEIKKRILNKYKQEYDEYINKQNKISEPVNIKQNEPNKNLDTDNIEKFNLSEFNIENSLQNFQINDVTYPYEDLNFKTKDSLLDNNVSTLNKGKVPVIPNRSLKPTTQSKETLQPIVDRQTKPCLLSVLSDTKILRVLVLPGDLVPRFLDLAEENTIQNIETCGILAGYLCCNELLVSHLLIPSQSGTSDSCTTENEEQLFAYQDGNELLTLGWIHTHPTQTAFMSSVDLHTQWGYQLMLPEAVAIVCAPSINETGFYSLTQDIGMTTIGSCQKSGFHHHGVSNSEIYEEPSHIIIRESLVITVVDFRRK